ncbi:MAG: hypothetical protein JWN03_1570 [Nocardia sp.]|uniref:hypothetical protein n=1 Tax=Nocardia sp. TaxID=1821 RepID=UPI0026123767|nr:hypothetical protein [Nocardia sp.]MCU1641295.1 hypothetical protein [Nocardia sp.]
MPASRTGRLLAEGIAVASLCFAGGAVVAAGDAAAEPVTLVSSDAGSSLSPTGFAAGSAEGGKHFCDAGGIAVSLSGNSSVTCKGITSGSGAS